MKRLLAVFLLVGCGGSAGAGSSVVATEQAVCMTNDTRECACPGGVKGAQTCLDDQSGWDKCACHEEPTPEVDAGSEAAIAPNTIDAGRCTKECHGLTVGGCKGICTGKCDGMAGAMSACPGTCEGTCTDTDYDNGATCTGTCGPL